MHWAHYPSLEKVEQQLAWLLPTNEQTLLDFW